MIASRAKGRVWLVVALVALAITACAPTTKRFEIDPKLAEAEAEKQRRLFLSEIIKDQLRLWRVAYPVVVAAAALCGDQVTLRLGIYLRNVHSYPKSYRKTAKAIYGEGEALRVVYVVPGSVAARAGFMAGDRLLAIGGDKLAKGKEASKRFRELRDKHLKAGAATFTLLRGGVETTITVAGEKACKYEIGLSARNSVNAFADGKRVIINRGMVRFAAQDAELATVIGHEIAHNAMGHINAQRGNALIGTVFDILAIAVGVNTQGVFGRMAGQVFSQDFEAEADYVGLYMTARAGHRIEDAPNLWRRMAVTFPASIKGGSSLMATHPSAPYRFLALEKTVAEIRAKQQKGVALMPDKLKERPAKGPDEEEPVSGELN